MSQQRRTGCLFSFFKLLRFLILEDEESLPYRKKDYLFTRAERSFYGVLTQAVDGKHLVFAKVRLADLLWIPRGTKDRQTHFNRIQAKHVDYLLCDRDSVRPLLAIELDDVSHDSASRRERDQFVERALSRADLPLLRIRVRRAYNLNEIRDRISQHLEPPTATQGAAP